MLFQKSIDFADRLPIAVYCWGCAAIASVLPWYDGSSPIDMLLTVYALVSMVTEATGVTFANNKIATPWRLGPGLPIFTCWRRTISVHAITHAICPKGIPYWYALELHTEANRTSVVLSSKEAREELLLRLASANMHLSIYRQAA